MVKRHWGKILVLIFLGVLILFVLQNPEINQYFRNPKRIREYVMSFGTLGPIVFILLYSLRTLLFTFPVAIFAILSGSLFGFGLGYFYSMIGAFLSATIAFFVGRYIARDFVHRNFSDRVKILKKRKVNGFSLILFLRLIVVMPYDALSYVVGVTKITYKDFILGNMLGIAFEFLMYAYIGSAPFRHHITMKEKIIFSSLVLIFFLTVYLIKRLLLKRKHRKKRLRIRLSVKKKYIRV